MEDLPINNGSGQSFGFTVYRKTVEIEANSQLKIRGHIRDFAQILINGQLQTCSDNAPFARTRKAKNNLLREQETVDFAKFATFDNYIIRGRVQITRAIRIIVLRPTKSDNDYANFLLLKASC